MLRRQIRLQKEINPKQCNIIRNKRKGQIDGDDMPPPARGCLPKGGGGHRNQLSFSFIIKMITYRLCPYSAKAHH